MRQVGLPRYEPVCTAPRGAGGKFYLPDKEFRYLRHSCYSSARAERLGRFCSAQLSTSPWRSDHLIALGQGVWRMASEDSAELVQRVRQSFLLIVRIGRIVTARFRASSAGYSDVPAYSQILQPPKC
jgi:hypothetical protein